MRNKDLKVGDKIFIFYPFLKESECHTIKSVKKNKTLVEVVVTAYYGKREYELIMYGHCSSCMLSGYDRRIPYRGGMYTCDYTKIEDETRIWERKEKLANAGRALLNIVEYFK